MNSRLLKVYEENRQILDSIIGLKIITAIEEQYFFEGKLDQESRGTLKLLFSSGKEITFNCDMDAQSIKIANGGFANKGTLETDFNDRVYQWKERNFLEQEELELLGQIKQTEISILNNDKTQVGCKISFPNGDILKIWTSPSDNIFYGINVE